MADENDRNKNRSTPPPTGRLARLTRLGSTATAVTARAALQKLKETVAPSADHAVARAEMLQRSGKDVAATLAELKGAAMKVGQLLSIDPQVLPHEVRSALSELQHGAPPMPFPMVEQVVSEALGGPLSSFFRSFDEQPLGAASIGQVHGAVTREGESVAVKVQYPGIADTIDSDVKNLGMVLQVSRVVTPGVQVDAYLEEFRQVLQREADYVQEADALRRYGELFRAEFPGTRTPRAFPGLTRKNVLTMERMHGRKLDEHLASLGHAERTELATRFLVTYMRLFHEFYTLHADPHPGNFLVDDDGNLIVLDFGCVRDFERRFSNGFTGLLRAQWKGDADALPALYRSMEFGTPDAKGLHDPEMLYDWGDVFLEPFLKDEEFNFPAWRLEDKATAFLKENPAILTLPPPRPALFYFRVCAGVRGMLTRTDSRVNVYRCAKGVDRRLRGKGV
ncbi:MAG: AarF/ABC1/UbiB kinase family protein [Myxococcota bacterium]